MHSDRFDRQAERRFARHYQEPTAHQVPRFSTRSQILINKHGIKTQALVRKAVFSLGPNCFFKQVDKGNYYRAHINGKDYYGNFRDVLHQIYPHIETLI